MVKGEHPIDKTTLDRVAKAMYYASLKSRDWEKLATDIKDYWLGEAETAITVYDEILLEDENAWKEDYPSWELNPGKSSKVWKDDKRAMKRRWIRHL